MSVSFVQISQEELTSNTYQKKLAQGARQGFFYIEYPKEWEPLIKKTVEFANTFYKDDYVKTRKLDGVSGYHDRKEVQVESYFLEKRHWDQELNSDDCKKLAVQMHAMVVDILRKTLAVCGIKEDQWTKGTGGVSDGQGKIHLSFHHYRSEKQAEGLKAHRDFGQIGMLFINKLGLQVRVEDKWVDVKPLAGHFIVNFGQCLKTFVNSEDLEAIVHKVIQVEDRISFGIFTDNKGDSAIFKRDQESKDLILVEESYDTYFYKCFQQAYNEDEKM